MEAFLERKRLPNNHLFFLSPSKMMKRHPKERLSRTVSVSTLLTRTPTRTSPPFVLDRTEDVRTIIKHPPEINRVLVGLNVTTITNKLRVARTLLTGHALTQFNATVQRLAESRMQDRFLAAPDGAAGQAILNAGWDVADNYITMTGKVIVAEWLKNLFPLVPWPKSSAIFANTVASQRICLYASTFRTSTTLTTRRFQISLLSEHCHAQSSR
jgi:hypothetical protein